MSNVDVDWDKPIELMDGTTPDGFLLNTLRLFCDCYGCIGGVQVVRNRKEPKKIKIDLWLAVPRLGSISIHPDKEDAERYLYNNLFACIHIQREVTEGEGIDHAGITDEDANLIAAAPDLLAVAEMVLNWDGHLSSFMDIEHAAETAVKKAKGEEN